MATRQAEKDRRREQRLAAEREAERAAGRRRRTIGLAGAVGVLAIAALVVVMARASDQRAPVGGSAAKIADVHGIAVNPADGALYVATHSGLFRAGPRESSARRVDAPEQDLMGFSVSGPDRFLASGHPGPEQNLPPALGLIESRDRGRTWRSLSLQGEADLHLLRATGEVVYAYDGRFRVSRDGGRTWRDQISPGEVVDMRPDPRRPDRLLASTTAGLRLSQDGGRSWTAAGLSQPALLAWPESGGPFAVDGAGRVFSSPDGENRWLAAGAVQGPPAAVTADNRGGLYVARPDGDVDQSSDGGRTWRPRSRN